MNVNTVLIAEDEPEVRNYLALALRCQGYNIEFAHDGEEALGYLKRDAGKVSLLLLDLIMPRKNGFDTLKQVRQTWPQLPVITLSGCCTPADVAAVMKDGAVDFLAKPIAPDDLLRAIQSVLSPNDSNEQADGTGHKDRQLAEQYFPREGTWSQRVESILNRMGTWDVPVLLRGETGVGKEVLARHLHAQSRRADRPFLKLNCAALPSELIESELFGYERGAFTGAFKSTPGKFEMAHKGTLLLDEIGDMDVKLQAKLLQVLQDQEFLRLGAKDMSRVDVRIMAATHRDLEEAIRQGAFREDLYYRLNIVGIFVPPLRERKDEIATLAEHFLRKYAPVETPELPPRLHEVLLNYDWPGNVRELENVIRRFLIFRSVEVIAAELKRKTSPLAVAAVLGSSVTMPSHNGADRASDVQPMSGSADASGRATSANTYFDAPSISSSTLAQVEEARKKAEKEAIVAALNTTLWNRKQAARLLKIDYKALLYKMKKLGIGETPAAPPADTSGNAA